MAGKRYKFGFSLRNDFQSFDALSSAFNPAEASLSQEGNKIFFFFADRYIEMRMRRVHLSMHTEGIKAFSKRIRCCSADGRKRYENDLWTQIFLKTEKNSSVFVFRFSVSSKTG